MVPVALSIAGSDPSGGAGIQADIKTFHQHGCYGCAVITLITVQNTRYLSRVELLSPELVGGQLDAVLQDMAPGAVKPGALGTSEIVEAVADRMKDLAVPLVVDPVLFSKQGATLTGEGARLALKRSLLPHALLVTPNLDEAQALAGRSARGREGRRDAARAIADLGAGAVLIKGGHDSGDAVDTLYLDGGFHDFAGARVDTPHTHGVGCALSAAITARLAMGEPLLEAVAKAKRWISSALSSNSPVGGGICAVNHRAPL